MLCALLAYTAEKKKRGEKRCHDDRTAERSRRQRRDDKLTLWERYIRGAQSARKDECFVRGRESVARAHFPAHLLPV